MERRVDRELREIVRGELANAVENGQTFEGWTTDQIVEDMCRYSPEVEGYTEEQVRPHVQEWRRERQQ